MTQPLAADHKCWWVAVGFEHVENREGGTVANKVKRVCRICSAVQYQIEVSHPDSCRVTVEPVESP